MNLSEWLNRIASLHISDMDFSLERVAEVAGRLKILPPACPVITVGGTNGKGSCVAGLEAIYLASSYKVGVFISPILFRHNEYIRIQGVDVSDEQFCAAFEQIDGMRGDITLTPFEFNALAAFIIFSQHQLDVWILEVGLGGRFDAVNVIDADLSMIATIGIDHVDWLGDTREKIAYEKAGIFRKNAFAVCGDFDPPEPLVNYAKELGCHLFCQNRQFGFAKHETSWSWWSDKNRFENLPLPKLALQNMSTVLMGIELLQDKLPVNFPAIKKALSEINLPARIQVISGEVTQIFDVSHNPAAADFLARWLRENVCHGKTRAVFSMLGDKDILGTIEVIKDCIDEWHISNLPIKRGASKDVLFHNFSTAEIEDIIFHNSVADAYQTALKMSQPNDRVVVFGSFHTVAGAKLLL